MKVVLAYISIIILWATTPLAIQWSAHGVSFVFAVASRMTIGVVCMLVYLLIRGQRLPWHRKAKLTYFVIAIQIYAAMLSVYWGAQFIPSGWVSVLFGLSPFITAFFSALWLKERSVTVAKIVAYFLGLGGLSIIFSSALQLNVQAVFGICGVLTAVILQTASAVWVKRIYAQLSAEIQVTGGLMFAFPAYLVTWLVVDQGQWPQQIPLSSLLSIVYLGVVATTIGFVLYYYLLIHLPTTTVGFIPMISPVIALYLGYAFNNEALSTELVIGTVLILSALLVHQFYDTFSERNKNIKQKSNVGKSKVNSRVNRLTFIYLGVISFAIQQKISSWNIVLLLAVLLVLRLLRLKVNNVN